MKSTNIKKYTYGNPVDTNAVIYKIIEEKTDFPVGTISHSEDLEGNLLSFSWNYTMSNHDMIFGLGENVRGINKRGFKYTSWCTDTPNHTETSESLYGAHNFFIISGKKTFGLFFDTASKISFDFGWTDSDKLSVYSENTGIAVYFITAETGHHDTSDAVNIVRQFRTIIGQSYIPPFWAFGFQQSRWGYKTEKDIQTVVQNYQKLNIPIDGVCLDIDYMDEYEDFTVDKKKFPDLKKLSDTMKKEGIHLIPIIDAGVKVKKNYRVYEEGIKNHYFCKKADGKEYTAGVWPGRSHFPDFLNSDARKWFGLQYKTLTDLGIEGFWNDMNEPAMFYSDESLQKSFATLKTFENKKLDINSFFQFSSVSGSTTNLLSDYKLFYHSIQKTDGSIQNISHDKVHNIFGSFMTQAASEGFKSFAPEKRFLLYSRSSCIGSHRYGGIWTGDNRSWWSHLKMELQMLPALNMCGFLYSGADIGGFGDNTSRDLLLRWIALGVFTPLMRNHSASGTRKQEFYQFGHPEDFKGIIELRYRLLPFIYSEFIKAVFNNTMLFRPLAFDYPKDYRACNIEDQLMFSDSIMIAPVYEQNALGRYVYLPEDMVQVVWNNGEVVQQTLQQKGDHFIEVPLTQIIFYIKPEKIIPLCPKALHTKDIRMDTFEFLGIPSKDASYSLYKDDGYTTDIHLDGRITKLTF